MGLFDFLFSKSYIDYETKGDRFLKVDNFGAAKLEYEKALSRLEADSVTNPLHHKDRIVKKISETKESLSNQHRMTAETLIETDSFGEAKDLLKLALELTEDDGSVQEIEGLLLDIDQQMYRHDYQERPEYESELNHENIESGDEYFLTLIGTMPKEIQKAYLGYGRSFMTGYVALNRGDFEAAAEMLSQALDEHDQDIGYIHFELATAYLNLGEMDHALILLKQFIQQYPDFIRAYEMLCDIYWEKEAFQKAYDLLMDSPDHLKTEMVINILMGETLYRSGKYNEVKAFYLEYIKQNGMNENIGMALARTYETLQEDSMARQVYGEIMNTCQSCGSRIDPVVKLKYAELSYKEGEISERLLDIYFSLVQENPKDRQLYYQRISDIYHQLGHFDEAERYLGFSKLADTEDSVND